MSATDIRGVGLDPLRDPTESLESHPLAEKEGFEPSFDAKSHGNSVGIPSVRPDHE